MLTETGKTAYARGITIQQQSEREIFSVLSREESSALHTLLSKIHNE